MEERKQKEIEYYDKQAKEWLKGKSIKGWGADFEGFNPYLLSSFAFCYKILEEKCKDKVVLDYGCGNGIHSIFPAKRGARKVVGIDLCEPSLEIAKKRAKQEGVEDKTEFLVMDCEKLEFPDNYFDIIFDGGTFSSIDLSKALPGLARVLKPNGFLIGIETLGHNPLTNLKRKINVLTGKRTKWAAEHIFKMKDLKQAENYFEKIETHFFHLTSWIIFPFLNLPGGKILLNLFEKIDHFLLFIFPFLRRYSFKIVFVFSAPKKLKIDK